MVKSIKSIKYSAQTTVRLPTLTGGGGSWRLPPNYDVLYGLELWYDKRGRVVGYNKANGENYGAPDGGPLPPGAYKAFTSMYPPGEGDCYPWVPDPAEIRAARAIPWYGPA